MTKERLMNLLGSTLLNSNAFNMYRLSDKVQARLNDWFDNSKGYYATRCQGHSITITYKGYTLFTIACKRHNDIIYHLVCCNEDFVDTETQQAKIEKDLLVRFNQLEDVDYFSGFTPEELINVLGAVQSVCKDKRERDIMRALDELSRSFWVYEQALLERGKNND